jgi:hypothetical protein
MSRDQHGFQVRRALQHGPPRGPRLRRVLAEDAVPIRVPHLQRVVNNIADEHGTFAATFQRYHRTTRRMARCRVQPQPGQQLRGALYQFGPAGLKNGADAVLEKALVHRLASFSGVQVAAPRVPVLGIRQGEDVARPREGGLPSATHPLRIPAHVVHMQVRADHEVNVFGGEASRGQPRQKRRLQPAEQRDARAHLVVAGAGVD